jgi:hypothetical protein
MCTTEGYRLSQLGPAYRDLGQAEPARDYLESARAILDEVESPAAEAVRNDLAELDDKGWSRLMPGNW